MTPETALTESLGSVSASTRPVRSSPLTTYPQKSRGSKIRSRAHKGNRHEDTPTSWMSVIKSLRQQNCIGDWGRSQYVSRRSWDQHILVVHRGFARYRNKCWVGTLHCKLLRQPSHSSKLQHNAPKQKFRLNTAETPIGFLPLLALPSSLPKVLTSFQPASTQRNSRHYLGTFKADYLYRNKSSVLQKELICRLSTLSYLIHPPIHIRNC